MHPRPYPSALLAAAVTTALALSGCSSDEDDAISTAEDFFGALADVDAEKACKLNLGADGEALSEEHADWDSCLNGVDTWASNTVMPAGGELPTVSFDTVEIDGDTARVSESAPAEFGFVHPFGLEKFDGHWYVDGQWYL